MQTSNETIIPPMPRSERQRQALRNAIARRKLEHMREEKDLNRFITEVWDEAVVAVPPRH
jgi:hypothetical protein